MRRKGDGRRETLTQQGWTHEPAAGVATVRISRGTRGNRRGDEIVKK